MASCAPLTALGPARRTRCLTSLERFRRDLHGLLLIFALYFGFPNHCKAESFSLEAPESVEERAFLRQPTRAS